MNDATPLFSKVSNITTMMATTADEAMGNVKINIKRPLRQIQDIPGFRHKKRPDQKIALIGGGPSLKESILELDGSFEVIVACGSSHDYLRGNVRMPHWAILCDPDPISVNYIKKPHPAIKYLVASHCSPRVFDYLKPYPEVYLWHCFSENFDEYNAIDPKFMAIGGGCTVGLRALSIAVMFGYSNIHFFGYDSCIGDDKKPYAYDLSADDQSIGGVHKIRIGNDSGPGDKEYQCLGYHLAQAANFKDFYGMYHEEFTPTFHGGGMMSDLYDFIKKETEKARLEQEASKEIENGRSYTIQVN